MNQHYSPFSKEDLLPKPEVLEIKKQKGELFIGIPKETRLEEKRVSLTPDAVAALTNHGHKIVIETGAGEQSNFYDKEYADSGAKIAYSNKDVFACNIILKVEPPSIEEIELMNPQSTLISALQLKTQKKQYFETLAKKRITAIAFDFIKDEHGVFPIVKSLSEIAGIASILIASNLLNKDNNENGWLLGNISGVPPIEIVIIGAGTVGEFAARSALGLGASVKIFDNSISKLRQLQHNLGKTVYTSTIQPKTLAKALKRCHVAIGSVRGKNRSPILVTESMVEQMREGSVIVDVSIDRGGCFETSEITTHSNPTFRKYDVIHYCVQNIPSKYARTASLSISNILTPYLLNIGEEGGIENAIKYDKSLQKGMYFYHGILTHKSVADWFNLPFRDIGLLLF